MDIPNEYKKQMYVYLNAFAPACQSLIIISRSYACPPSRLDNPPPAEEKGQMKAR